MTGELRGARGAGMAWMILIVAGLFETGWTLGLKESRGFTRLWPSVGCVASMVVSLALMAASVRSLPIGTAYAVWTGIGAVGAVFVGIALYHESADPKRMACIALIVAGIVGLKLVSPE